MGFFKKLSKPSNTAPNTRGRLALEQLENRYLLTTFMVDSPLDNAIPNDGLTTLREAITLANNNNNNSTVDKIHFDSSVLNGIISLNTALPEINEPLTIEADAGNASSTDRVTIDGFNTPSGSGLVFDINVSSSVLDLRIQGLDLISFAAHGIDVQDLPEDYTLKIQANLLGGNLGAGIHVNTGWTPFVPNDFKRLEITDVNLIVLNGTGIHFEDFAQTAIQITDNFIGSDGTSLTLGNTSHGLLFETTGISSIEGTNEIAFNLISGNGEDGIRLDNATFTFPGVINDNIIGLDASASFPIPNAGNGFSGLNRSRANLQSNQIGGNLGHGIHTDGTGAHDFISNFIGVNELGTPINLGNGGDGINIVRAVGELAPAGGNDAIANKIFFNGGTGISVSASNSAVNINVRENEFRGNGGGTPFDLINSNFPGTVGPTPNDPDDLDNGPSGFRNYPVIDVTGIAINQGVLSIPTNYDGDFDLTEVDDFLFEIFKVTDSDQYDLIASVEFDVDFDSNGDFFKLLMLQEGTDLNYGDSISITATYDPDEPLPGFLSGSGSSEFSPPIKVILPGDFDENGVVDAFDLDVWMGSFGNTGPIGFTPGDADGDGDVDGADFLVWQMHVNTPMPLVTGDYNHDGIVNEPDFVVWKSNFGTSYAAADGNGNGIVDLADLAVYEAHFMFTTLEVMPGDFNDSGVVDSDDYFLWAAGDMLADADGDGDVDGDDFDIFEANFGLTSVAVAPMITTVTTGMPFEIPMAAPQVISLSLDNSSSSFDFTTVIGSGEQLRSVPLSGADTVSIRFSEEVFVTENTLQVTNLDGTSPASVTSFTYDIATQTATWVFSSTLADGRHLLTLADEIYDLDHEQLDGEYRNAWTLADTTSGVFPSGDGEAGGDFHFHATILAGDTNHDNIDGATDYTQWLSTEPGRIYVSTTVDEIDGDLSMGDVSLREAVQYANAASEPTTIILPTGRYVLSRIGTELGDSSNNDLDITSIVTVVGDGPGRSVVDSSGLASMSNQLYNRSFHVEGDGTRLAISGVTLTGGNSGASVSGTAVLASDRAIFELTDSAVVNNSGFGDGVAIRSSASDVTIKRSVFTNNVSTQNDAALYATKKSYYAGSVTIGESLFALNQADNGTVTPNVWVQNGITKINDGNNLYDDASGNFFNQNPGAGDHLGTPDYVVTTVADTFDHTDDHESLSLREAVDLANTDTGASEVWLPAWNFVLTRDRGTNVTDTDVSYGDLDIKDSLVIRGVTGVTSVAWTPGVVDDVFDLLGDFTGDGINSNDDGVVDASDHAIWQQQQGSTGGTYSADGDDDGDVDQDDEDIWTAYSGNTLDLFDVLV